MLFIIRELLIKTATRSLIIPVRVSIILKRKEVDDEHIMGVEYNRADMEQSSVATQ